MSKAGKRKLLEMSLTAGFIEKISVNKLNEEKGNLEAEACIQLISQGVPDVN